MIAFTVAARAAEAGEDEDVVEVPIDGITYYARQPTLGQSALLAEARAGGNTLAMIRAVWQMAEAMMGPEAREHLERLVWEGRIDLTDLVSGSEQNDKGLFSQIQEEFTARPTKPSTASSSSQGSGGRKSTARSRGKGSIHSETSPSPDSSTPSSSGRSRASSATEK